MLYRYHAVWHDLYERLRGPDWPPCPPEVDFFLLPDWVQNELIGFGYIPVADHPKRFYTTGTNTKTVFYLDHHNGGGTEFGQEYAEVISNRWPGRRFRHGLEWCSGPGFIAFNLLAHDLVDRVSLSDVCLDALECARESAQYHKNQCHDRVEAYLTQRIDMLPRHLKFDLVVGNPPHAPALQVPGEITHNWNRITTDWDWQAHREFFSSIRSYLDDDAVILLQENECSSRWSDFEPMLSQHGLRIRDWWRSKQWYDDKDPRDPTTWPSNKIYYLEVVPV